MSGTIPIGNSLHADAFQTSRISQQSTQKSSGRQPEVSSEEDVKSTAGRSSAVDAEQAREKEESERTSSASPAVESLFRQSGFQLSFRVHEETKQVVISVIDQESKEVIRQVPPEELLELAEKLDTIRGSVVQQKV